MGFQPEQGLVDGAAIAAPSPLRAYPRHRLQNLAYVTVDQGNGGILRDLSEGGLALQAVAPLHPRQRVLLRFDLLNPRVRVETQGRVCWADSNGQAGLQFEMLSSSTRGILKDWIFTQLLMTAHQAFTTDNLLTAATAEDAPELKFSSAPMSSIRLPLRAREAREVWEENTSSRSRHWLTTERLAWLVDALFLVSAVLLFSVVALAVARELPTWPVALALACGAAATFTGIYWFLFVFWSGTTPGMYFSGMASGSSDEEDDERFR
jgi:hypothetical protein